MGVYIIEAVRIGGTTILVSYAVKCLGKVDMAKIIKMTGMSFAGISLLRGLKYAYDNPPQWIITIRDIGRGTNKALDTTTKIADQIIHGDIKGLFGL